MFKPYCRIVRHAQPLVAPGVCYGRLDVAADSAHTEQVAQALLAAWDGVPPLLLHSPMQRCVQLLEAVRVLLAESGLQWAVRAEPLLAEMDFGHWEGQTWDAIGPDALDAWTRDFAHYRPGGGESVAQFMQRVGQVWQATQRHMARTDQPVWWLAHAGVARAAHCWQHGVQVQQAIDWPQEGLAYGMWVDMPQIQALAQW
ncbi:histidine phosphatase family protein [Curvibacter sp. CHRR-16]|uniref:histidine phosphatase family protein n=1 Tax=Curvibacter sp. CHRR-16 TaxID=2835872 RepID=UPI001BDA9593|nr:histidine phosphatase family protein [Curvibacter sp. CHRR-16]